jgi:DNA-binding NtrC family response regulator
MSISITLIAPESMPISEIRHHLVKQDLDISLIRLDASFYSGGVASDGSFFLVLDDQDLIKSGELTNRVRNVLGAGKRLVLCMPFPTDRATLFEMGADDIITPAAKAIAQVAERIFAQLILDGAVQPQNYGSLYGATRPMRQLFEQIGTFAPLDEPLLILGETGTGKELIAQEIHNRSGRLGECLAVNCAEFNRDLLASELFGHEKGAFTNASYTREGLFAAAGAGTILLDEIGDLDLQSQAKLLRVLEERKVRRLGANRWENIKARILLATNHNLEEDIHAGSFRRDLFERIRGFTLESPPLRERKADIPLLVEHLVTCYANEYNLGSLSVPSGAVDNLFRYDWPGNVRELRSVARRAAAYADANGQISAVVLQEAARGDKKVHHKNNVQFDPKTDTWRDAQRLLQQAYFRAILNEARGNKEMAIRLSGLSRSQFYEKLKEIEDSDIQP